MHPTADALKGAKKRCTIMASNPTGRKFKESVDFFWIVFRWLVSGRVTEWFLQLHKRPAKVIRAAKLLPFTQYGHQEVMR